MARSLERHFYLFALLIGASLMLCSCVEPEGEGSSGNGEPYGGVTDGLSPEDIQDMAQAIAFASDLNSNIADDVLPGNPEINAQRKSLPAQNRLWAAVGGGPLPSDQCVDIAMAEVCNSGKRTLGYNRCVKKDTKSLIIGGVGLTYSKGDCSLSNSGDYVERDSVVISENAVGRRRISSTAPHKTFDGTRISGGGERLTRLGPYARSIDIFGVRNRFTNSSNADELDMSIRTLESILISGSFDLTSRTVERGVLQIFNNASRSIFEINYDTLMWTGNCCYPTQGKMEISFQKGETLDFQVEFTSTCGDYNLTRSNVTETFNLPACENRY